MRVGLARVEQKPENPEAAKARRRSSSAFSGRADMCAYCQGRAGGGQVCN